MIIKPALFLSLQLTSMNDFVCFMHMFDLLRVLKMLFKQLRFFVALGFFMKLIIEKKHILQLCTIFQPIID